MELLIKNYHNCLTNESINQSTENFGNCFPAIKTINGSACSRNTNQLSIFNRVFLERLSDVKKLQLYSKNSNDNFGFKKMFGI